MHPDMHSHMSTLNKKKTGREQTDKAERQYKDR